LAFCNSLRNRASYILELVTTRSKIL